MADRDAKYFNCSEAHELVQVARKYRDREGVTAFIKEKCKDKTIHYWTHEKLAAFLEENGFQLVKTVSQTDFIASLAERLGSKAQAKDATQAVLEGIAEILKSGDALTIKGFGTFRVDERAARKGIHPRTKEEIDIPASKTVKFTPSKVLKDAVAAK